jgi:peptide-methionine (R)-S-oxide reductase
MANEADKADQADKIEKSDAEWRAQLDSERYEVCRLKGTEPPFSGKYNACKDEGVYRCSCCGNELFRSDEKFDSGTGWPSFTDPITQGSVRTETDQSHGMQRVEVMCARCDAHLGHVFEDGPAPSGKRYCMNSVSLDLDRKD